MGSSSILATNLPKKLRFRVSFANPKSFGGCTLGASLNRDKRHNRGAIIRGKRRNNFR
jgi:hypothetical protein